VQSTIDVPGGFIESVPLSTLHFTQSNITLKSSLPQNVNIQMPVAPGGAINPPPLVPGYSTEINVEVIQEGWQNNTGGI
jgi:hypothetical protein